MKKTTIILFIMLTFQGYSQSLESGFGLMYSNNENYRINDLTFSLNKITAVNQLRLTKDKFCLVSNIAVMMSKSKNKITFTPSLASFDLELRYFVNKFMFSAAHRCVHPISTYSNPLEFQIYGGYDLKIKVLYNIK